MIVRKILIYIYHVYNSDKSKIKDDVKSGLASVSEMSAKMESYYLKQYNFDIYEEAIKDEIKESNKDYFIVNTIFSEFI